MYGKHPGTWLSASLCPLRGSLGVPVPVIWSVFPLVGQVTNQAEANERRLVMYVASIRQHADSAVNSGSACAVVGSVGSDGVA